MALKVGHGLSGRGPLPHLQFHSEMLGATVDNFSGQQPEERAV
jgi:hypothetical protein